MIRNLVESEGKQTLSRAQAIAVIILLMNYSECTLAMGTDESRADVDITCENIHETTIAKTVDKLRKVNIPHIGKIICIPQFGRFIPNLGRPSPKYVKLSQYLAAISQILAYLPTSFGRFTHKLYLR